MYSFCVLMFLCIGIFAKDLHIKEIEPVATTEYVMTAEGDNNFQDLYGYDDVFYGEKERYARHAEFVTESVLEHLLMEIKKKYPDSKNNTSGIPKMMKRLQMKLNQMNKKKNKKHMKALHKKHRVKHTEELEPKTTSME